MRFIGTQLTDAVIVEPEPHRDDRGFFARSFCEQEFRTQGLATAFVQCNISWNERRGTVRGMHYQLPPSSEAKLVRCTAGSIWDVIVDLRPESPTYLRHVGVELSAENRLALYVPEMFAHGFQTLADNSEVFYQMSSVHVPELATGLRHDDPKLGISWPLAVTSISKKDRDWALLQQR